MSRSHQMPEHQEGESDILLPRPFKHIRIHSRTYQFYWTSRNVMNFGPSKQPQSEIKITKPNYCFSWSNSPISSSNSYVQITVSPNVLGRHMETGIGSIWNLKTHIILHLLEKNANRGWVSSVIFSIICHPASSDSEIYLIVCLNCAHVRITSKFSCRPDP